MAIPKFNMVQLQESVEKDANAEGPLFQVVQNSAKFMQHEGDENYSTNPFDLEEQDAAEFDFSQGRARGPTFGGIKDFKADIRQHQQPKQREHENEEESDLAGISFSKKPPQYSEEAKLGHSSAAKPARLDLMSTQ